MPTEPGPRRRSLPYDVRPPHSGLPPSVRTAAAWSVSVILFIAVAWVVVYAFVAMRAATIPLILALLGTALLYPVMPRLLKLGMGRGAAAGLTCTALVVLVGGVIAILVNSLMHSAPQIGRSLEQAGHRLSSWLGPLGPTLQNLLSDGSSSGSSLTSSLANGVLSSLSLVTEILTGSVLALALVFFFLRDGHRTGDLVRSLIPDDRAETVIACGRRAFEAMAGFMRGTTLIALIDATCITVGLLILGVPGAPGLGALVFMGAYIPFVGAFLSGSVAVLVALAEGGLTEALWALGIVLAVQAVEGNILQPVIQSRTVALHPATIMIAVVAGSGIAGILGALLAVPLCAAALGVISVLREAGRAEPAEPGATLLPTAGPAPAESQP